ncbi:MAG: carbon-nitrogen hydrolase family protein [Isosphaeraceae bacterium]|nr:carbon-nitrogen hydrolase family protein [Isosphaeraceae bacterium]
MRMIVGAAVLLIVGSSSALPQEQPSSGASRPEVGRRLRVAASQMRSSSDAGANLAKIERTILECGRRGVRVVVFPECALTSYSAEAARGATSEFLKESERVIGEACRRAGTAAVVGSPWRSGDALYNSALVFDATGRVVERYHKLQLAEDWPTPGDHLSVFGLDGVRCCVIICHDERYPELVRLPVLAGARVVFYISHESGLTQERKLGPYRAQIQARAVENGVFVVQSNAPANREGGGSHGQSRVVGPDGNLMGEEASMFGEDLLVVDLELEAADAANARRSLTRGPLAEWWKQGAASVRILP